jgi:hypothetical protein
VPVAGGRTGFAIPPEPLTMPRFEAERSSVSRTIFLVAIAVALLMMQFFPGHADIIKWAVMAFGVAYLSIRALLTYPTLYKERRRRAAERAEDEAAYGRYRTELDSIRARHEPQPAPQDTAAAQAYEAALSALHDKYGAMLDRRFGPGPRGRKVP